MENKECTCCKETKPLSEFHKGTGKLGLRSQCKVCCTKWNTSERYKKMQDAKNIKRQDPKYKARESFMAQQRRKKSPEKFLYAAIKSKAKRKGIEFNLTLEDIIFPEICPLLEIKLQMNKGHMEDNSYSLDRIDNTKGYIKGNVWVISNKANKIKNDATLEDLQLLVKNLTLLLTDKQQLKLNL